MNSKDETRFFTRPLAALAMVGGILCLTFLAYGPVIHAGWVWDDDSWITENPAISDSAGLHTIWTSVPRMQYYPLTFTTFWVEHRLYGFDPLGYHLINVLLHACNAFLVGWILSTLGVPGAFWVAALFAVHPVHVESVAWVTERKNVLSGLFCLGSALAFFRWDKERSRRGLYAAALALFVCALLAKTATATLPVALALVLAWRQWPLRGKAVAPLAPFVLVAVGFASITVFLEQGMVDVVGGDFALTTWQRFAVAARSFLFYPAKLAVPYPLIFNYPRFDVTSGSAGVALPFLAAVAIAAGLAYLWHRGRRGLACAVGVYAVMIFPALGFIDVYAFRFSFVADHFQYLASIPLLALVVRGACSIPDARWARALGAATVALLAVLTWTQAGAYRDEATLWRDTIAKNPDSWIAHHNLARLRSQAGELDLAIAGFTEAIRCKPGSAESYTARGLAYGKQNRLELALSDLNRALELDPGYPEAFLDRGEVFLAAKRFDEAVSDLNRFVAFNPGVVQAYTDLANAHVQLGQDAAALDDLNHAIDLNRGSAELLSRKGFVLVRLQRYDEALAAFDEASRIDPALAITYVLRGGLYQRMDGNTARACRDWEQACRRGDCKLFAAECKR